MATTTEALGEWIHRPMTGIDPDLIPFFEGIKQHRFPLCRCKRCGRWWFPYTLCRHHDDIPEFDEMEWATSSGRGTIFAKVVVHQVIDPAATAEVPYALAIVELEEGPHFPARLVECDPHAAQIGDRVEAVYFDSDRAGHTMVFFRPAG